MRLYEIIREVKIDNSRGWGAVPYNAEIDYMGLKVLMRPSIFLKLALPLTEPVSKNNIKAHISAGGTIGAPFLSIRIPEEWDDSNFKMHAKVVGHEGRNRMSAILELEGDNPVEVHILPVGGYRRRDLTDDMVAAMNRGLYVEQSDKILPGRIFTPV